MREIKFRGKRINNNQFDSDKELKDKYLNKIIYAYPIKCFCKIDKIKNGWIYIQNTFEAKFREWEIGVVDDE